MLVVFLLIVDHLFNGRMKFGKALLFVGMGEVDRLVSTGGSNVELRVKHINARDYSTESWHCECSVAFILSRSILTDSGNHISIRS